MSQDEASKHFCIAENGQLARIELLIEKKVRPKFVRRLLEAKYEEWLARTKSGGPGDSSRFTVGNGPKIHKYILNLIYRSGAAVDERDLLWLVKNNPSMRSSALRYLSRSRRNNTNLGEICAMVRRGIFVDDASFVDISGFMLHARFQRTTKCMALAREFCSIALGRSDIGLHSAVFVAGKFLGKPEVLRILNENANRLAGDFWLSRAAAGLAPIFMGEPEWDRYRELIESLDSDDASDVLKYMLSVMEEETYSASLKAYLGASNDTYPQALFFPKVLVLLAASKNPAVSTLAPWLYTRHPALKRDPFYRSMGFS